MRSFRGQRPATAAVVLSIAALLAACSPPTQPIPSAPATSQPAPPSVPPVESGTPPSATPRPVATATPPPAAHVDFWPQNGTFGMTLPADWSVDDRSGYEANPYGQLQWVNSIAFSSPEGVQLVHYDGHWGDVGPVGDEPELRIVELHSIGDGLAATAWWEHPSGGPYWPSIAISADDAPYRVFSTPAGERIHTFEMTIPQGARELESLAEVEAFMAGDEAKLALDVLASVRFTTASHAPPEGAQVEADGRMMVPFTTANGSSSFLIPTGWTTRDADVGEIERERDWIVGNAVTVVDEGGEPVLEYMDFVRADPTDNIPVDEVWEGIFEGRHTTDGWSAVPWMEPEEAGPGRIGVGLTSDGSREWGEGGVCVERVCRVFSGGMSDIDSGTPDEWIASDRIQTMLAVVASLDIHHDDVTRPPH